MFAFAISMGMLTICTCSCRARGSGERFARPVQNPVSAALLGIDGRQIAALGFGLSVATAAAAGAVYGMIFPFNPGSHYDLISRLLAIVVLGGLGSIGGAVIAALFMGVSEAVLATTISPTWSSFAFFIVLHRHPRRAAPGVVRRHGARSDVSRFRPLGLVIAVVVFGALVVFPILVPANWIVNIAIFTLMYAGLATAWNLLGGYSGYVSLGHVAFFGIGAYAIAIAFQHGGIGNGYVPFLVLPLVGVGAALVSMPIGVGRVPHARSDVRDRHDDVPVRRATAGVQPARR